MTRGLLVHLGLPSCGTGDLFCALALHACAHRPDNFSRACYAERYAHNERGIKSCVWFVIRLSGVAAGESTLNIVLQHNDMAVAHANTYFTVVEGHGRFFGSNLTTLVDGHGTAAFFRSPANRSTVAWDPDEYHSNCLRKTSCLGRHTHSRWRRTHPGTMLSSLNCTRSRCGWMWASSA